MNPLYLIVLAVVVPILLFVVARLNDVHAAARADWGPRIAKLLARCPERVNEPDKLGQTPLMHASKFAAMASMAALLDGGADVSAQCNQGGTALHWAAWFGHEEAVRLLLDHGASPEAVDREGTTPIDFAHHRGHDDLAVLLESGSGQGRA